MQCYCPSCGYRNQYATIKPIHCQGCDAPLEPKPVAREKPVAKRQPGYDPIERDEEGIGEGLDFDMEAVKRSVRVVRDGNEGGFTKITAEWARDGAGGGRGGVPEEIAGVRDEVLNGLLSGKGLATRGETAPPPDLDKPRSTARRQPSRIAPPA